MDTILWSEAIKIPSPEAILTVFWQLMMYFWKADMDDNFYRSRTFPVAVEDVRLRIDHRFYERQRYHVMEVREGEASGVWDETPFCIEYSFPCDRPVYIDHGDMRHPYQLFLRSFLKTIRPYTKHHRSLHLLKRILMKLPVLTWKCPVCKKYNQWSRDFIEATLLDRSLSIAPSTLLYLLTYRNDLRGGNATSNGDTVHADQLHDFLEILAETLYSFFSGFEKIYEQTSIDPVHILKNLLDILLRHARDRPVEEVGAYETECAKEMKAYLFQQFKFLKTKSVKVNHFPRTLMILREVFASVIQIWRTSDSLPHSSPGIVILLGYLLMKDHAISNSSATTSSRPPLLVAYPVSVDQPIVREMVPPESEQLRDYHPVLRPYLFLSNLDDD